MPGPNPTIYTTKCDTDENGNLVLEFPDELLDAMGWKEGTELEFDLLPDTLIIREIRQDNTTKTSSSSGRKSTAKGGTKTTATKAK